MTIARATSTKGIPSAESSSASLQSTTGTWGMCGCRSDSVLIARFQAISSSGTVVLQSLRTRSRVKSMPQSPVSAPCLAVATTDTLIASQLELRPGLTAIGCLKPNLDKVIVIAAKLLRGSTGIFLLRSHYVTSATTRGVVASKEKNMLGHPFRGGPL